MTSPLKCTHSSFSHRKRIPNKSRKRLVAHLFRELFSLGLHILNRTRHVESRLRKRVVLTRDDLLEGPDGILKGNELTLVTSEDLGDLERLRHEPLDLTGTFDLKRRTIINNRGRNTFERQYIQSTCPLQTILPYPI